MIGTIIIWEHGVDDARALGAIIHGMCYMTTKRIFEMCVCVCVCVMGGGAKKEA